MSRFGFVYAHLHSNITESNTKMDAHDPKPAFLLMKRLPCDRTTRFLLVSRKRRWLTHQNRYSHKPNRSVFPNSVPRWIRFPSPGTYIKTALIPKGIRAVKLSYGAGDGNRTRVISLEGWGSTIELRPQDMVGTTGFEPATSCSQSRRATKLRHVPKVLSS